MQERIHNPTDGIYAATGDYVHAREVRSADRFLFVSGTMGLAADGSAGAGFDQQLTLIWGNLKRILAEADMSTDNIVRITSYLRDPAFAAANMEARKAALQGRLVPTTAIVAATLETDWLVEVEIIAAA